MAKAAGLNSESRFLLSSLLKEVSRSFYLTLRILPGAVRPQIGVAYLLARTSDTIADTELVPIAGRLQALETFARQIQTDLSGSMPIRALDEFGSHQENPAERVLLGKIPATLEVLNQLHLGDRTLVRQVLATIISGQELDLRRFASATGQNVVALHSAAELDDYTYRVAGCVGEFWTRITHAHLFPSAPLELPDFLAKGILFGKGLQLVNILRDLPADLKQGRCYLPTSELDTVGLTPVDLLTPESETRLRPVYDAHLNDAERKLRHGWHYTHTIPRRQVRVRLACAWPILIGLETIHLLRSSKVLKPASRVKVSRKTVRGLMARSILYYPWPGAWTRLADRPQRTETRPGAPATLA